VSQVVQLATHERVEASDPEGTDDALEGALQVLVDRVVPQQLAVEVLQQHGATGPGDADHLRDRLEGIRQVLQQEAAEDPVERAGVERQRTRVGPQQAQVGGWLLTIDEVGGSGQPRVGAVDTDDGGPWAISGDAGRDDRRAAADVQDPGRGRQFRRDMPAGPRGGVDLGGQPVGLPRVLHQVRRGAHELLGWRVGRPPCR
jgi:hypothetical protein